MMLKVEQVVDKSTNSMVKIQCGEQHLKGLNK